MESILVFLLLHFRPMRDGVVALLGFLGIERASYTDRAFCPWRRKPNVATRLPSCHGIVYLWRYLKRKQCVRRCATWRGRPLDFMGVEAETPSLTKAQITIQPVLPKWALVCIASDGSGSERDETGNRISQRMDAMVVASLCFEHPRTTHPGTSAMRALEAPRSPAGHRSVISACLSLSRYPATAHSVDQLPYPGPPVSMASRARTRRCVPTLPAIRR